MLVASKPRKHNPRRFVHYGIAVAAVATASFATGLMQAERQRSVTLFFFAAVMISGWIGGLGPGLLAATLSLGALHPFFYTRTGFSAMEGTVSLVFLAVSVAISLLNEWRRRAEMQLREHQHTLEQGISERTEQLNTANQRLELEVAERKRAEQTLRISEENYRLLFEEAPVAYHEIDENGIICRVNKAECELLGYSQSELIGKLVWELVAEEEREKSRAQVLAKTAGTLSVRPFSRSYTRRDGGIVHLEIHEGLIRNSVGKVVGIRSSLLDITARCEAEAEIRKLNAELEKRVLDRTAELRRSNEALQQFAYSASHDLQEPLRMVASYAQLLQKRVGDKLDEDGREFLYYIKDGADRMTRMVRDLLTFSRAGNAETSTIENISMEEIMGIALANMQAALEDTAAVVRWDPLPTVAARKAGLSQIIQNLLSNSLKYRSETAPDIFVRCEQKGGEWVFCIEDNGLGFDPRRAEKAFGIFQRLHGNTYPGSGMGLAICKRIVERNGGRIWADSEPGKGSKFYFTIPVEPGSLEESLEPGTTTC